MLAQAERPYNRVMVNGTDPALVYHGDPAAWLLSPHARWALRFGQITPREAREQYDLIRLWSATFFRRLAKGEIALTSPSMLR